MKKTAKKPLKLDPQRLRLRADTLRTIESTALEGVQGGMLPETIVGVG